MEIIEEYKHLFQPRIRKRGRLYFFKGAVQDVSVRGNRITCSVKGRRKYRVGVRFYPDHRPELHCTCPFFEEWGDNCKHIWALFLYIDAMVEEGELEYSTVFGDNSRKDWKSLKQTIKEHEYPGAGACDEPEKGFYIFYCLDRDGVSGKNRFSFTLKEIFRKRKGTWGRAREISSVPGSDVILTAEDRKILTVLKGEESLSASGVYMSRYTVSGDLCGFVIPLMHATGRLQVREADGECKPLDYDMTSGWEFSLDISGTGKGYMLSGAWTVRGRSMSHDRIDLLSGSDGSWLLAGDTLYFRKRTDRDIWEQCFFRNPEVSMPEPDIEDFIAYYNSNQYTMPEVNLPQELMYEEAVITDVKRAAYIHFSHDTFWAEPAFMYNQEWEFSSLSESIWYIDMHAEKRIRRNRAMEEELETELKKVGFSKTGRWYHCGPGQIQDILESLASTGWSLYGEDRHSRIAIPSSVSVRISSKTDWFELEGDVEFDSTKVAVGHVIESLRRGNRFIELGEGQLGLLPEQWIDRYRDLFSVAEKHDGGFRVNRIQAGLLQEISEDEHTEYDRDFAKLRSAMETFTGISRIEPPGGFRGSLREYQKAGLGWLEFLDTYRFGGCLGDDMGLGKTVQVLAFLQKKRRERRGLNVLIVVPASIIFNWVSEARRFTPDLSLLTFWGPERKRNWKNRSRYDIILTSYATMVRDIGFLKEETFDYVVFDEAQHLKNYNTKRSRAARKLRARLKLSLTGTPLENHLGDLWSQFSLLDPGLLGSLNRFKKKFIEQDNTDTLKKLIFPFILRRTKKEVLSDLPEKVDDILYCEMEDRQRKYYNEVRDVFRMKLLNLIDAKGISGSRMNILEGLLRLRQICCYPGLVDARRTGDSGKLASLKSMVEEIVEEGGKALIFSQFTKMLSVIRNWVETMDIPYEYLDGKTKDRQERISSFQNDENIRLFLISLKAGGVGVNLTAADYVFIYDPWWNPAVENQAIDRAYRIGRDKPVFTYRMITHESIEEKIHALQKRKKELVSDVIDASERTVFELKQKDIEYLFT